MFPIPLEIVGIKDTQTSVCTGIEMFRKSLDEGQAGDNVGVLLRGIKREDIERGQVLCKPGSVHPHTKFTGEMYVLTKDEGGRHTPFFTGYRPQFYFRTTDITGRVDLPEGIEMVMPGDHVTITGDPHSPDRHGGGPALRYSRGWPHCWFGPRFYHHRVVSLVMPCWSPASKGVGLFSVSVSLHVLE